jgi:predicted metal-dependent enzyme (double-stranded beta helix superfamily)
MPNIDRLRQFVQDLTRLVARPAIGEAALLADVRPLLRDLITHDDWLPDAFAEPDPARYRQYLLHCDPLERFSLVSFVWGPGQSTPVHDHTTWGMVGMMRGKERCQEYRIANPGKPLQKTGDHLLEPGQIDLVSPTIGDIHLVSNALADRPSVSIHVYGANIGALSRHVFEPMSSEAREFISGYSNATVPNLWDRSTA